MTPELLSPEDTELLKQKYSKSSARLDDISADDFAEAVALRIRREWSADPNREKQNDVENSRKAFERWLQDETYFALERKGLLPAGPEQFAQMRQEIMDAVVKKATMLFGSWMSMIGPLDVKIDKRNLRGPLGEFLHQNQTQHAA